MIKPKNLLIVRTDRIGDVILSLPIAEIIKKHFPECRITFLVRDYTKEILNDHPFIDDVIILKELNGKIPITENVKLIRPYQFDNSIIVYPTFQTSFIIFLSGIKNRIGTGYRWYSFFFNKRLYEHRKYADNVNFNIRINKQSIKKVEDVLASDGIKNDRFLIIVHPGSGSSAVDLPLNKFKVLVEELAKKDNYQIIFTGSKSETEMCNELKVNSEVKSYAGMFNLSELIALISRSNMFIANSTGPLHIAAALDKYVIGFYPNLLACSAKRWGPFTNKKTIFTPNSDCVDCRREQCSRSNCMNTINVMEIVAEVDRIYNLNFE
jgi:heptosyltransferase-3